MKISLFALVVSLAAAAASAGQQSGAAVEDVAGSLRPPASGWSITPALVMSRTYDDNVLLHGPGDPQTPDAITVINPRGQADYHGRLSDFSIRYDGAIVRYQNLETLNSYEQHAGISGKRHLSKRNTFFYNGSMAAAPTTELLQFNGVPFVRVGTFTDDMRAGVESLLTKNTTLSVDGSFQQARFDVTQAYANLLLGGNSIGGDLALRHHISERTSLTFDADAQHATIGTAEQVFDIQHAVVGVERQLTEGIRAFISGGISRLGVTNFGPPRTGPSWKMGIVENYRGTIVDVSFVRSFVPSFGFGGTMQNQEFTARLRVPITHRLYTQDLISWRREDPIAIEVPQLQSTWMQAAVGYVANSWFRVEAYYAGTRQTAQRPDELLDHNQFGIQVIASKPVRIR